MLEAINMKRKTLIIFLITGIIGIGAFAFLSSLFHQEVPENTIRILIDKPMNQQHYRLQPLLEHEQYAYIAQEEDFKLVPKNPKLPTLQFHLVKDENTRALLFLKGDSDVMYDTLSIAKTEWVKKQLVPSKAQIFSSPGDSVSELAINDENIKLQNPSVIAAINDALPIKHWAETVFFNWVEPIKKDWIETKPPSQNITLQYLTTYSREGQQLAFLTREALGKIGINVVIHIFEPSLFYTKIKKREFDLFSSTRVNGNKNILDLPHTKTIPLFRWKHGLIIGKRIAVPANIESSLDYSFRFLSELQLQ